MYNKKRINKQMSSSSNNQNQTNHNSQTAINQTADYLRDLLNSQMNTT